MLAAKKPLQGHGQAGCSRSCEDSARTRPAPGAGKRNSLHPGCERAAEGKAAMARRLVEKISDGCTERSSQNESRPEQKHAGDAGPIVQRGQQYESRTEKERASAVSQSGTVRHPISKCGPQGLRERDRNPVEDFYLRRRNSLNVVRICARSDCDREHLRA